MLRHMGANMEVELPADQRLSRNFDRAAARYDLLNTLNPGYRKHLSWSAKRLAAPNKARLLDLCCGTGLSTEALVRAYPDAEVSALDASAGMLARARSKPALSRVHFVEGDAMDPAAAGAGGPYDGILMAYGIRNVLDRDVCLQRLHALLSPGGRVAFHEYSVAGNPVGQVVWNAVATGVIIPLGTVFTRTPELFRYLRRSVNEFDAVDTFVRRLGAAGFSDVEVLPMDGWQRGIAHTFVARRSET